DLVVNRQGELVVVGPYEQPLQREGRSQADHVANWKGDLERQSDEVGEDHRREDVDARHEAAGHGEAKALAEQTAVSREQSRSQARRGRILDYARLPPD